MGKLAGTTRHTPAGNYNTWVRGYDSAGNPWDSWVEIPASETGLAGRHQTGFSWTTTGLLTGTDLVTMGGLPDEGVGVGYDRYGNPQVTGGYNSYVSATTYTPYGEPAQYNLGVLNSTGTLTYNRDPQTRRVTQVNLSVQQAWPQVDDLRYSYDPAGNITRIVNVQGHPQNGAPTRTQCFTYDPLNRLSQAWTATDNCAAAPGAGNVGGVNPYRTSWVFDPTGLRTSQVHHALPGATGGDTTTSYTYPTPGEGAVRPHALTSTTTTGPAGQSGTSYGYDPSGNTTARTLPSGNQTLTWTEHNRLASVTTPTGTTSYVYDADGNQLIRRDPGKTTLYLPGQEIVRDTTTGTVTGTRYYIHNGTTVALRVGGANPQYLQSDQHATTQVAVASVGFATTRRTFDPYGNPLGTSQGGPWPDQRGFLNKPHNPVTGLSDVGARKYDPTTGRFISVDPILDPANPQQWNAYGYANNNPTTHSDPTGLFCDGCEYAGSGDNHGPGCSVDTTGHCRSQEEVQTEWDVMTGRNTDRSKQPRIGGHTVPTFDELKQRPGFAHYMDGGTYGEAVQDWAYNICTGSRSPDQDFCAVAAALGWLDGVGLGITGDLVWQMTPVADVVNCVTGKESCWWILLNVAPPLKGARAIANIADAARTVDNVSDATRTWDNLVRGACSFTGDTQVLMADGTHKPIKDIKVGDQVLATDPDTGDKGPRTVTAVWVHEDTVLDLVTNDGGTVTTTEDHPFYNTTDQAWQRADQLNPGDQLHTDTGHRVRVKARRPSSARITTAYNLSVDDIHTYHVVVGKHEVLVHNDCAPQPLGRGSTGRASPENLNEQLAMKQAMSDPASGRVVVMRDPMNDARWAGSDGWVKMRQNINGIEIHYLRNVRPGEVDDYKFK